MWPGRTDQENGGWLPGWGWRLWQQPEDDKWLWSHLRSQDAALKSQGSQWRWEASLHIDLYSQEMAHDSLWLWAYAPTSYYYPIILLLSFFILEDWDPFQVLITNGLSLQEELPHTQSHTQFGQSFQGSVLLSFWTWGSIIRPIHSSLVTRSHKREENGVSD